MILQFLQCHGGLLFFEHVHLDILMVSKKRIDERFSLSQGFKEIYATRFRIDNTTHGGDIVLFVRDDILC